MKKTKSKYLLKYEFLKKQDSNTVYLFEKGSFYIALLNDATLLNQKLKLSIYKFNPETIAVGFPKKSIQEYEKKFNKNNITFKLITFEKESKNSSKVYNKWLEKINQLDLSQTTPIQAFNFLYNLQKEIKKEGANS